MRSAELDFSYVRRLVHDSAAIVLDDGKDYLIRSRLTGLLAREGAVDLSALLERVPRDAALQERVVEAMTTNETSFFRDIHPFETLRAAILPRLAERRPHRRLNVWSAACSSGQEAYSIAMTLCEALDLDAWHVRILATDVSREMVERVRAGRYSQLEVNRGLPARKLLRHFAREGDEWVVEPALRRIVQARRMNLGASYAGLPPLDLVFMRNVLIYFDLETRRSILGRLHGAMRPDALLLLGSAETTTHVDDRFQRLRLGRTTCFCLDPAAWRPTESER